MIFLLHITVGVAFFFAGSQWVSAAFFLMSYPSDIAFALGALMVLLTFPLNYYSIKYYLKLFNRRTK